MGKILGYLRCERRRRRSLFLWFPIRAATIYDSPQHQVVCAGKMPIFPKVEAGKQYMWSSPTRMAPSVGSNVKCTCAFISPRSIELPDVRSHYGACKQVHMRQKQVTALVRWLAHRHLPHADGVDGRKDWNGEDLHLQVYWNPSYL